MTVTDENVSRFDHALLLLPFRLRELARTVTRSDRERAEELRLRSGRPLCVLLPEGELDLGGGPVTVRDLELLVETATGASVHTSSEFLKNGFIPCRGGCRVGLCGSVFTAGGAVGGFRSYSSASIRIARAHPGIAAPLMPALYKNGSFASTLIIAPPGAGKTTLLRELVRSVATPSPDRPGQRVALCDERGEIAALHDGLPQLDVGPLTDVLDSCPKPQGVMMLLRVMNPQIIALDEITSPEDLAAIERARNCGVALLATAHGSGPADLLSRPLYRDMLRSGIFENYITIKNTRGRRSYTVTKGGEDL